MAGGFYFWICHLGMIQFDGMDGGVLVSAAWQMHLGYQPYRDIITACPPLFLLGAKWAFDWFGVSWASLVRIAACHAAIALVLQYALARRVFSRPWSLLLAASTPAVTTLLFSFWWYNNITEIHAVLFFTAALGWQRRPSRASEILVVATGAILLLSKVNVALPLIGLVWLCFMYDPPNARGRLRVTLAFVAMAAAALGGLLLMGATPRDLLENYAVFSGRIGWATMKAFLYGNQAWEVRQTTLMIVPILIALKIWLATHFRLHREREQRSVILMAAASAITAFIATATNNTFNMSELPLAFVGLAVLLTIAWSAPRARSHTAAVAMAVTAILAVSGNGINIAQQRLAIMEAMPGAFFQDGIKPVEDGPEFFSGVIGGPNLHMTIDGFESIMSICHCRNSDARVFIGPRIDWAYAAYGIKPPRGLPIFWEIAPRLQPKYQATFEKADIQVAVFLRHDFTFLPLPLVAKLQNTYSYGEILALTFYLNPKVGRLEDLSVRR